MADTLTPRQDRLAREYVKTGNKTLAAKRAGYAPVSAHSIGHDTLKIPKVAKAVERHRRAMAERMDLSREKLMNDAAHDAEQASMKGDFGAANANRSFIAKAQGYLIERSINVNVDLSEAHLTALRGLSDRGARSLTITDVDDRGDVRGECLPIQGKGITR